MATEYGFVYFLGNECMPGIYKIGFTTNHPKTRLEQLSSSTSCPMAFELMAAFGVINPRETEQEIHLELQNYRVSSSREFFRISATHALDICRMYGDPCDDLFHTWPLEHLADREEKAAEVRWKKAYFESQNADPIFWPEKRSIDFDDDIPFPR